MGVGTSSFLIAVGAILDFAVTAQARNAPYPDRTVVYDERTF
jgi:hypothetical protein